MSYLNMNLLKLEFNLYVLLANENLYQINKKIIINKKM